MNPEISKCCTCGYEWKTGQSGDHSCSESLLKRLELADAENARLQSTIDGANAQEAEEVTTQPSRIGNTEYSAGHPISIVLDSAYRNFRNPAQQSSDQALQLLSESRENFEKRFGFSADADWAYKDLAELFISDLPERQSPAVDGEWSYGEDNDGWYVECKGEQVCYCASEASARRISEAMSMKSPAVAVPDNKFGDNLLWFLREFASADDDQLEYAELEIYGEGESGVEGVCTVSVQEICEAAASTIEMLTGSPSPRITEQGTDELLPLHPIDHPDCQVMLWSEQEIAAIKDYAKRCIAALPDRVTEQDALQKLRVEVAEAINILAMCGDKTPVDQIGKKLCDALNASALLNKLSDKPECNHDYHHFGTEQKRRRCNNCLQLEPESVGG